MECYHAHLPTVTCRMELKHLGCSVTIKETKINSARDEERNSVANMCRENGLPECCTELVSLTFCHTSPQVPDKQEVMQDYATGYILEFTDDRFSKWMQMFESQTQTEYGIQRGSYQNRDCANGLLKWKGKMMKYNTKWSQVYQCKRGGKGKIRPETLEGKRNTPVSTKLGCTASLRACLLSTEKGEILEVTVPRYSAHCGHDVGSLPDLLTHKPLPEIEKKVEKLVRHSRLSHTSLHLALNHWIKNELIPA